MKTLMIWFKGKTLEKIPDSYQENSRFFFRIKKKNSKKITFDRQRREIKSIEEGRKLGADVLFREHCWRGLGDNMIVFYEFVRFGGIKNGTIHFVDETGEEVAYFPVNEIKEICFSLI
ncbi:MAG: hypothetical protein UU10_C0035G0002 [Parcubacteria group bacterium GW2011_GWF1_40_6]|nr:MAG: hypothetical protein UT05_C0009G0082 [Parcubacteria group bacterium GW2011_GWF2_38_76]KKR67842.1 MAG: hypothetical protein UU10_C0035G0002 [Parcubacteria group bacterium GW2011_GWF1_40_6]HBM45522.1 hypothetical protein [Patescibacteria group bacterium]